MTCRNSYINLLITLTCRNSLINPLITLICGNSLINPVTNKFYFEISMRVANETGSESLKDQLHQNLLTQTSLKLSMSSFNNSNKAGIEFTLII